MNNMKQIPLQEKIAELESRIAVLEKLVSKGYTSTTTTRTVEVNNVNTDVDEVFGPGWTKMWDGFAETMKQAFGRK